MGVRSRLRSWLGLSEAAPAVDGAITAPRKGYEYGTAIGGTTKATVVAQSSERLQILNQLHQAYLTCPWVSSPVDLIGRTVTAGGLQLEYENSDKNSDKIPPDPAEVTRLRRLMRFVNPREDMVQLLRQTVIDLELFGDAYLEVVRIAGEPVAIYTLDATTMTVITDAHGEVTGYIQQLDGVRKTEFDVDDVIHISLDSPRGGIYGVSSAQKALLPVTAWLFTEATIKENFRRGDPPRVHVDLAAADDADVQSWREKYMVFNLGPKSIGNPVITTRKGTVSVLDPRKVTDYLLASKQLRDEIIACFGVPPAKLGIIETGNIGGGSGEAQDKTFRIDKIIPVRSLVLEKLNYHILQRGFGIVDWKLEFGQIDMRDSEVVEKIRDIRLKNGSYTLNRYRDEIGEPAVDGGDVPVMIDRSYMFSWADAELMSKAQILYRAKASSTGMVQQAMADEMGLGPQVPAVAPAGAFLPYAPPEMQPEPPPEPAPPSPPPPEGDPDDVPNPELPADDRPGGPNDAKQGKAPRESAHQRDTRLLDEAWQRSYRARRRQALKELPQPVEVA